MEALGRRDAAGGEVEVLTVESKVEAELSLLAVRETAGVQNR